MHGGLHLKWTAPPPCRPSRSSMSARSPHPQPAITVTPPSLRRPDCLSVIPLRRFPRCLCNEATARSAPMETKDLKCKAFRARTNNRKERITYSVHCSNSDLELLRTRSEPNCSQYRRVHASTMRRSACPHVRPPRSLSVVHARGQFCATFPASEQVTLSLSLLTLPETENESTTPSGRASSVPFRKERRNNYSDIACSRPSDPPTPSRPSNGDRRGRKRRDDEGKGCTNSYIKPHRSTRWEEGGGGRVSFHVEAH